MTSWANRITAVAAIITAFATAALALLVYALLNSAGSSASQHLSGFVQQTACTQYVNFVLDRANEGMSAPQIQRLWDATMAHGVQSGDKFDQAPGNGGCGTPATIVQYEKKLKTHHASRR